MKFYRRTGGWMDSLGIASRGFFVVALNLGFQCIRIEFGST